MQDDRNDHMICNNIMLNDVDLKLTRLCDLSLSFFTAVSSPSSVAALRLPPWFVRVARAGALDAMFMNNNIVLNPTAMVYDGLCDLCEIRKLHKRIRFFINSY